MQLHPTLDKFYLSILKYAGLKYEDGVIKNISSSICDPKVDDKPLTLPYFDNLRNPAERHIFHPLNENYASPETTFLAIYKKRLTLEVNLKLMAMMFSLLRVASEPQLQRKIKSPRLLTIISGLGEVDMSVTENLVTILKHAQKALEEAFLVDFHIKKNGKVAETPYAAIGKVNFLFLKELNRALAEKEDGYRVFGYKCRKRDILILIDLFDVIFPDSQDKDKYTTGTDMKVFRYFNALLLSSYTVTAAVNEVASLLKELKEPSLEIEEMVSDLTWAEVLEEVYGLSGEIRAIPNQTNSQVESHKLKLKEPDVPHPQATHHVSGPIPPSFNPSNVQRSHPPAQHAAHPVQPPYPQSQQPHQAPPPQVPRGPMGPEEIIRNSVAQQEAQQMQYMQQQGFYQPNMHMQQPMYPQQGYPQPQYQQPMQQPLMVRPDGYPPQMYQPNIQQQFQQPQVHQQAMSPEEALRRINQQQPPQYNYHHSY